MVESKKSKNIQIRGTTEESVLMQALQCIKAILQKKTRHVQLLQWLRGTRNKTTKFPMFFFPLSEILALRSRDEYEPSVNKHRLKTHHKKRIQTPPPPWAHKKRSCFHLTPSNYLKSGVNEGLSMFSL